MWLTVHSEIIRGNDELKAVLNGDLHVRNVLAVTVFVPVVEVLDDLFKNDTTREATVSTMALRYLNLCRASAYGIVKSYQIKCS